MKASPVHAVGRAHSHCTRAHLDTEACTRLCVHSVQLEGNTTNQQWWLQWTGICWDRIDFNYKLFHPILYHMKVKVLLAQSCPTLCNPMDCSLPGSSVRGILQGRILEWVAIPFSRGSSRFRDQTRSPTLQADPLPSELAGKPIFYHIWIYLVFLIVFCQRRKETLAMDCNPRFQAKTSCHHSWWSQANLSFLICKMGITVVPPSLDCCEN